jgi:hypothetical protein
MILFLGDSFTWGQGLLFERWITEEQKSQEYCNNFLPAGRFEQELFSYKDDLYRKTYHFPNLVAKHFNKPYVNQFGNGGTNYNILNILKNLKYQFGSSVIKSIECFIIQFTDFSRCVPTDGRSINFDFEIELHKQCNNIFSEINNISPSIPIYTFSWRGDIGDILQNKYKENYIPLIYNNIEYNNFDDILNNISLKSKYPNLNDEHFSIEGHEFISKNIISKLENSKNISFTIFS